MTDISVIKMIISVAVWRIYPSWMNDRLRAWEGLGHSAMFWARLSRDDFRLKLENISFLSRVMFISKSFFCFPRFCKIWRQTFELWGFWFRRCLGALFENSASSPGIFCELWIRPWVFLKFSFLFSKQSWCHLPDSYGDLQAEQSTFRMKTWLPGVGEIDRWILRRIVDRSRDRYESLAVIHSPKEKKHSEVRVWLSGVSTLHRLQNPASFRSLFRRPADVATVFTSLFSCTLMHSCRSVSGCSAGTAKRSSHPWHFRCWSPKRNELECTDLVHWTAALNRFSSRDAIIVVGSVTNLC